MDPLCSQGEFYVIHLPFTRLPSPEMRSDQIMENHIMNDEKVDRLTSYTWEQPLKSDFL
jgi:hypothetical protein